MPNRKAMVTLAEQTFAEFKVLSKEGGAMDAEAVQQAQQPGGRAEASTTLPGMVIGEDGLLDFSGVATVLRCSAICLERWRLPCSKQWLQGTLTELPMLDACKLCR